MKRTAIALASAFAAPGLASADVVTHTVQFDWTEAGFVELVLPKYAGSSPVRGVRLTFSGETSRYYDEFAGDDPIPLPQLPVSWTLALAGPAIDQGGGISYAPLGAQTVYTAFPAIDQPPDPGVAVTRATPIKTFAFTVSAPNVSPYIGLGDNMFLAKSGTDTWTRFRGVVTQTITVGVPEPSTWGLMILGLGGAGVMLRRGRARSDPQQLRST